jgi:hypothetical protein
MPQKPHSVKKLFVVREYVFARSAEEALKLERTLKPDEVFLDDDWRKMSTQDKSSAIGFMASSYEDDY